MTYKDSGAEIEARMAEEIENRKKMDEILGVGYHENLRSALINWAIFEPKAVAEIHQAVHADWDSVIAIAKAKLTEEAQHAGDDAPAPRE